MYVPVVTLLLRRLGRLLLVLSFLCTLILFTGQWQLLWAQGPAPVITGLSPSSAYAGGPSFTLTITGTNFVAPLTVRWNGGASQIPTSMTATQLTVPIDASYIAAPGTAAVQVCWFTNCSAPATFTILPAALIPPTLVSVGPGVVAAGARQVRLTLSGSNFRRGAQVRISPAPSCHMTSAAAVDVSVDSSMVVNDRLIFAVVSVSEQAQPCARTVDVINADTSSTLRSGTSKTLLVTSGNSLAAPLQATGVALISPRNGGVLAQGDDLFGEALVAGTGTGLITGEWLWDGNVVEQFTANITGGQRAVVRTNSPLPTSYLGLHTLQLRITSPNLLQTSAVQLMVNPGDWKLARLLAPGSGAGYSSSAPPLLRWTIIPGAARYEVGFATRPYFNAVEKWFDARDTQWQVPDKTWQRLSEGELYWTVRAVDISGSPRKPAAMRSIWHVGAGTLSPASAAPKVSSTGSVLLEWMPLQKPGIYRVTVTRDPDGNDILRRFLTAVPQCDLRSLQALLESGRTYFWQVEALSHDGRRIAIGPRSSFAAPRSAVPSAMNRRWSIGSPASGWGGAGEAAAKIGTRVPAPNESVAQERPAIRVEFKSPVKAADVTLALDDTDMTALAQVSETKVVLSSPLPLANGEHQIGITVGADSDSWAFRVSAKTTVAPAMAQSNDAEVITAPAAKPETAGTDIGPEFHTQFGLNPQLLSGSNPKTISMNLGEQMVFQNGPWRVETNGTGLLTALLSPEPQYTIGRFNDYIGRIVYDRGKFGGDVRFGILAPTLYSDAEFVTLGTPREGLESKLHTMIGNFGFFTNTNDANLGAGQAAMFHQAARGASYDAPLPAKVAQLRLMWLSSKDIGTQAVTLLDASGNPVQGIDALAKPGAGDTYGGLLQLHLAPTWLWSSEYAWSKTTRDISTDAPWNFGRAWRSGITGTWRNTTAMVAYRDVSPNFGNLGNPGLSLLSTPDRRGVDAAITQRSKLGNFNFGCQFQQSAVNQPDRPELTLQNLTWGWTRSIRTGTMISLQGHDTQTSTGSLPPALATKPPEELLGMQTDQRDLGFTATVAQQMGGLNLSASGSRGWLRNDLIAGQNTITSGVQVGGTWKPKGFFQLQSNVGSNWVAQDKLTIGLHRTLSVYVLPMFSCQHTGLSVAPLVSYTEAKGNLGTGLQTQNMMSSQAGGRVSWRLPGMLRFSVFSFEGAWIRARNSVVETGMPTTNLTDKRLMFLLTLVGNYDHSGF